MLQLKLFKICPGHENSVCSLAFSTDGQLLASGSLDGIVQIWDINSCNLKCTLDGPGGGIEVRFHDNCFIVTWLMCKLNLNVCLVGQVASKRASSLGWFRGFDCLDVECGQKFLS